MAAIYSRLGRECDFIGASRGIWPAGCRRRTGYRPDGGKYRAVYVDHGGYDDAPDPSDCAARPQSGASAGK